MKPSPLLLRFLGNRIQTISHPIERQTNAHFQMLYCQLQQPSLCFCIHLRSMAIYFLPISYKLSLSQPRHPGAQLSNGPIEKFVLLSFLNSCSITRRTCAKEMSKLSFQIAPKIPFSPHNPTSKIPKPPIWNFEPPCCKAGYTASTLPSWFIRCSAMSKHVSLYNIFSSSFLTNYPEKRFHKNVISIHLVTMCRLRCQANLTGYHKSVLLANCRVQLILSYYSCHTDISSDGYLEFDFHTYFMQP